MNMLQSTQTTRRDPHSSLHRLAAGPRKRQLQLSSKASGLAGSSCSLAPLSPNWNIWGSQLPSMWGWMGLASLSRAHPLT